MSPRIDRRGFLRAGLGAGVLASHTRLIAQSALTGPVVSLVADPSDAVASADAPRWAMDELARRLSDAGATVRRFERMDQVNREGLAVVASGHTSNVSKAALARAKVVVADAPEALAVIPATISGRRAVLACGADARGLVYALLDLVDRVQHSSTVTAALSLTTPVVERPTNVVRSVMRQFVSETLDKPWFYDRDQWASYLTMLATHRFNRLHLGFGLGYDMLQQVTDSYFVFMYPFLLAAPGYDVRVSNLTDAERDRNLDMIRFISEQTVARGLDFQIGLWMHGYQLSNSPQARHVVQGLTPATHAAYCRDALTALLQACPKISSVALRIHGESGIAEGSYDFWATIFDGVKRCGRSVEIDVHAKGTDATMIGNAVATGLPVNVSPKYWAEHLGMPYHQAAIRDLEMPVAGQTGRGLMTLSEGQRVFTRYGYADLMREDRQYTVRHRVFAGTQRILASGDPAGAAAYSRMFTFAGSTGVDLMEPLTCRGRRGTATASSRLGYRDRTLDPKWDWEKYSYWYRTWGRLTYNAETTPDVWQREFSAIPVAEARALESALARASRILPLVTTAHLPSAACDAYWPEMYWNQSFAAPTGPNPYGDTPAPKTFQNVSPLDPQLFSRLSDFADDMVKGEHSAKYSPMEVAWWLDDLAKGALADLARSGDPSTPARRRLVIDIEMQALLGQFFAAKFRAGALLAIHERTNDTETLLLASGAFLKATTAWADLVKRASVYADDLAVSDKISARGSWADRAAALRQELNALALRAAAGQRNTGAGGGDMLQQAAAAKSRVDEVSAILARPTRATLPCTHTPPRGFTPGAPLPLSVTVTGTARPTSVTLWYRHLNQAERFQSIEMQAAGSDFRASIPAGYTDSPYPLQYYVEFRTSPTNAWLYPGFTPDRLNQPYFVLRGNG